MKPISQLVATIFLLSISFQMIGQSSGKGQEGSRIDTIIVPKKAKSDAKQVPKKAESDAKQVTYDFKNKSIFYSEINDIDQGGFFQIVVDSINLNLYSITIEYDDSTYTSPIKIPSFTSFDLSSISEILKSVKNLTITSEPEKAEAPLEQEPFNIPMFNSVGDYFEKSFQIPINRRCDSLSILNNIYKLTLANEHFKNMLGSFSALIDGKKNELNKKLISSKLLDEKLELSKDTILNYFDQYSKIKTNLRDELLPFREKYNTYNSQINSCKDSIKSQQAALSEAQENYKTLITAFDLLESSISSENIYKIMQPLVGAANNSKTTYKSLPIQMKSEQVDLTLTITPKDSIDLPSYFSKIQFPKKEKNKFHLGSMLYAGFLNNEAVSFGPNAEGEIKAIDEDTSQIEIGAAMSFHYEVGDNFHFFAAPGITVTNTVRPRLLAGFGGSFGEAHKFTINLGLIMGEVDVRSKAIDSNIAYNPTPASGVVTKMKVAPFISIGYFFVKPQ